MSKEPYYLNENPYYSKENFDWLNKTVISAKNKETGAYLSLSLGDLIYDTLRVDPRVIEAVDFVRIGNLSNAFKIGEQEIKDRAEKSLSSLESLYSNYTGYTAERIIALDYQQKGYEVVFPKNANNPGFDILVNGQEFQIKFQKNGISLLNEHFEKYPNIPVIANSEAAIEFHSKFPDKADLVIDSGFSFDASSDLLLTSTDASVEIFQDEHLFGSFLPEILGIVSIISIVKNLNYLSKGEIDRSTAFKNIAIDSAGKFASAGLGAKAGSILGPIGSIVGGTIGYLVGNTIVDGVRLSFFDKETNTIHTSLFNYIKAAEHILKNNLKVFKKKTTTLDKKLKKKSDIMAIVVKYDKYNKAKQFHEFFKKKVIEEEEKRKKILLNIFITLRDFKKATTFEYSKKYRYLISNKLFKDGSDEIGKYILEIIVFCRNSGVSPNFIKEEFKNVGDVFNDYMKVLKKAGISLH
jgi:hypothetical protein